MKVKNLDIDRWQFEFTVDMRSGADATEKYAKYLKLLYPEHETIASPTCDHCGQQHLRFVFWSKCPTLPEPNNWARVGSSCILEWLIGKLKSTCLYTNDELARIGRQLIMPDKLNKPTFLRNNGRNWWSGMNWKQLRWLKSSLDGYSIAVYTKPWLVLGHKGNLTVKLVDPLPSYISVFLEIAPQLETQSEVLTCLKTDGCLIETNFIFSEESALEALTAFKQRLYLYLINDLRAVIEQEGYSEWRALRRQGVVNMLAGYVLKLEACEQTPPIVTQLSEARKSLSSALELLFEELGKDKKFTSWCADLVSKARHLLQHEKATKVLAELARREMAGEA